MRLQAFYIHDFDIYCRVYGNFEIVHVRVWRKITCILYAIMLVYDIFNCILVVGILKYTVTATYNMYISYRCICTIFIVYKSTNFIIFHNIYAWNGLDCLYYMFWYLSVCLVSINVCRDEFHLNIYISIYTFL